ncbi:MAG: 50S ribosomal protein L33 [Patescibacteria group bacterium]
MAKKGEAVIKVGLVCSVCRSRNYVTHKNKINMEGKKILLNKYCRKCRKHTSHKETEKLK